MELMKGLCNVACQWKHCSDNSEQNLRLVSRFALYATRDPPLDRQRLKEVNARQPLDVFVLTAYTTVRLVQLPENNFHKGWDSTHLAIWGLSELWQNTFAYRVIGEICLFVEVTLLDRRSTPLTISPALLCQGFRDYGNHTSITTDYAVEAFVSVQGAKSCWGWQSSHP